MYKSKDSFLENQQREAQDRNEMAERQAQEHMASGERFQIAKGNLEAAKTPTELQAVGLALIGFMLKNDGLSEERISQIRAAVLQYGDAVRLEMLEQFHIDPVVELFGANSDLNPDLKS